MQFKKKLENGEKPDLGFDFGVFGPNLPPTPIFFSWALSLLNVRHCCKLSFYAISRKAHDPNSRKWRKTSFWA